MPVPPTELTFFDLDLALRVAQEMGCEGVIQQVKKKSTAPSTFEEFLACFTQECAREDFLERYPNQL